ncbi:MAG: hypothetical protein K1X94_08545 [Sandaracinaceae bacterium]|nr:hypothetical protein [Sandaracinaceae bacterium]
MRRLSSTLGPLAACAALALVMAGCPEGDPVVDAALPPPRILSIDVASPALVGSLLRVRGVDLDRLGSDPTLSALEGSTPLFMLTEAPGSAEDALDFRLTRSAVDALGEGTHTIDVVVEGRGLVSERYTLALEIASELPLALDEGLTGTAHRNDVVVLHGAGFVGGDEGDLVLHVTGDFARDGGGTSPLDVSLPVAQVELTDRGRGVAVLTTDLGGVFPGELTGTARLERTLASGATASTDPQPVSLTFLPPELFSFDGAMASVGRLVTVRGAGFLGGADRPTETTLLRISGMFTPQGGAATPLSGELVPRFVSGAEVRVVVETEVRDGLVIARLFGAQRGVFEGTVTPITIAGHDEVSGATAPLRLVLGPPVQVVHLRFLPGYYDSLARFGLASAEDDVADAIVRRMEEIYAGVNLDVRLEEPADFDATATTAVEIGGPDPNGNGLFGYDNSAGKDVGNVRMFDAIGGANAETQADGFPGFGGVFVESMLWWSAHPELPGEMPTSAPDPDPLFDELFDPVRTHPVTRAELAGEASPERSAEIRRAIDALGAIVGETSAHELGHSLGMAQPYGPVTAFHRDDDGDGCVMDRGGDRPLAERAAQAGAARSSFCDDEPAYLQEILGP